MWSHSYNYEWGTVYIEFLRIHTRSGVVDQKSTCKYLRYLWLYSRSMHQILYYTEIGMAHAECMETGQPSRQSHFSTKSLWGMRDGELMHALQVTQECMYVLKSWWHNYVRRNTASVGGMYNQRVVRVEDTSRRKLQSCDTKWTALASR